jgi:hypothetical protein
MSPHIETDPGRSLNEVWVYLSREEALELREALNYWASEPPDPKWHYHVTDSRRRDSREP